MIKVDTYGDSANSSTIYILIYHVTMQINKLPQLAMELQCERDGGMILQGTGWGVSQIPWANRVWPDVNRRTHGNLSYPFCPLSSIIDFFQKVDELVNALGRARHGSLMAWLSKPAVWGTRILASAASKPTWMCAQIVNPVVIWMLWFIVIYPIILIIQGGGYPLMYCALTIHSGAGSLWCSVSLCYSLSGSVEVWFHSVCPCEIVICM